MFGFRYTISSNRIEIPISQYLIQLINTRRVEFYRSFPYQAIREIFLFSCITPRNATKESVGIVLHEKKKGKNDPFKCVLIGRKDVAKQFISAIRHFKGEEWYQQNIILYQTCMGRRKLLRFLQGRLTRRGRNEGFVMR